MKRHAIPLLMAATLSLSACSSRKVESNWVSPGVDRTHYQRVYLAPSQFYPPPKANARIPSKTLSEVTGYYDAALRLELGKVVPLASRPGPDTLVVRPVITRIAVTTQGLRFYEWLPVTLVAAGVSAATGIRDQDSEIATELTFEDGQSGAMVASLMRRGTGVPLDNDKQVMTADNVKAVLDNWASDVRESYVSLHHRG